MSEFMILDDADSRQIEATDTGIRQSLAYDLRGKKQISFAGIKWLILQMSQKEQPMSIEIVQDKLDRYGENKAEWVWYATVRATNQKTGLETIGASEQPYQLNNGTKDPFGRTKALSKAERNAYRKQIPEIEIQAMLDAAKPGQIHRIETSGPSGPTPEQVQFLQAKGAKIPPTRFEAAKLVKEMSDE